MFEIKGKNHTFSVSLLGAIAGGYLLSILLDGIGAIIHGPKPKVVVTENKDESK